MVVGPENPPDRLVSSVTMGTFLTKRRAVDLCRVATCLCRPVI
jgi:hypothetical protein